VDAFPTSSLVKFEPRQFPLSRLLSGLKYNPAEACRKYDIAVFNFKYGFGQLIFLFKKLNRPQFELAIPCKSRNWGRWLDRLPLNVHSPAKRLTVFLMDRVEPGPGGRGQLFRAVCGFAVTQRCASP
jgi:hypothetical protein